MVRPYLLEGRPVYNLPSGAMEPGESIFSLVKREFEEEVSLKLPDDADFYLLSQAPFVTSQFNRQTEVI